MTLTALILGAGPGVGHTVAAKLISTGYAVAAASRNPDLTIAQTIGFHALKADLAQPDTIPALFRRAQEALGAAPNVVIYNAWAATPASDPEDILAGVSAAQLSTEYNVNTISMWAAAQAAVSGWKTLDAAAPRAFIFTGNLLPWINMPAYVSLGIGKASSAHIIEALANTYGKKGSRFYFAYQVSHTDGGLYYGIDGPITASTYLELINRTEQGGWRVAFDKDGKDWHAAEQV